MKIVIAGGTGYLGSLLCNHFKQDKNNSLYILSREQQTNVDNIHYLQWDGKTLGYWLEFMENTDIIINLSGKSVNCRYTKSNKAKIYSSRLDSTYILCQAINCLKNPPKCFIQMSSATIYEHSLLNRNTVENGRIGNDFSMDVCKKWEEVFNTFEFDNTEKVILRSSIVLGEKGGAFPIMKQMVRFGFGGKQGKGNQMISWISEQDFVRSVQFMIDKPSGIYNICSPNPLINMRFQKLISQKLKPLCRFNLPKFMIYIGAKFMGTESELVLKSRNVYPEKLLQNGFVFSHPEFDLVL